VTNIAIESDQVNSVWFVRIADSGLTSSTEQDTPPVNLFAMHSGTKIQRSSEKVHSTVPMERTTQSKSRSLDTAARQTWLTLDGKQNLARTEAESLPHRASANSGQADRHSLKQLAIGRVSQFGFLIGLWLFFLSVFHYQGW